jgi:hypothetical protein
MEGGAPLIRERISVIFNTKQLNRRKNNNNNVQRPAVHNSHHVLRKRNRTRTTQFRIFFFFDYYYYYSYHYYSRKTRPYRILSLYVPPRTRDRRPSICVGFSVCCVSACLSVCLSICPCAFLRPKGAPPTNQNPRAPPNSWSLHVCAAAATLREEQHHILYTREKRARERSPHMPINTHTR